MTGLAEYMGACRCTASAVEAIEVEQRPVSITMKTIGLSDNPRASDWSRARLTGNEHVQCLSPGGPILGIGCVVLPCLVVYGGMLEI